MSGKINDDSLQQQLTAKLDKLDEEMRDLEIERTSVRCRLECLELYRRGRSNTNATGPKESHSTIQHRSQTLGHEVNKRGKTDGFVKQMMTLDADGIVLLAQVYTKNERWSHFLAKDLNDFVKRHEVSSKGKPEYKSVESGVKSAGGLFREIYNEAMLRDLEMAAFTSPDQHTTLPNLARAEKRRRIDRDPSGMTGAPKRTAFAAGSRPDATFVLFDKAVARKKFHPQAIEMMEMDNSWGVGSRGANYRAHVWKTTAQLLIDVPEGCDPEQIKIFSDCEWGTVHFDTVQRIVINTRKEVADEMFFPDDPVVAQLSTI